MSNTVTLELTEEELGLATWFSYVFTSGIAPARNTLLRKLAAEFVDVFGVDPSDAFYFNKPPVKARSTDAGVILSLIENSRVKPEVATFNYHGYVRRVQNPTVDASKNLLSGFELTRGGRKSEQFKHFKLNEIG